MAVAPLNQVRKVVEYALTQIPAEKIDLGRQCNGSTIPILPHGLCYLLHKSGKSIPVLRQNVLKVYVNPLIALFFHNIQKILNKTLC